MDESDMYKRVESLYRCLVKSWLYKDDIMFKTKQEALTSLYSIKAETEETHFRLFTIPVSSLSLYMAGRPTDHSQPKPNKAMPSEQTC